MPERVDVRTCPLSERCRLLRDGRHGEGFRMPAVAGRGSWRGPAYGNRPSTNPRGTIATLWGFKDSDVAAAVARRVRSGARGRHRAEQTVCDCTVVARPRRQARRSGGYQRCG